MKSFHNKVFGVLAVAIMMITFVGTSEAASITITPGAQTIGIGGTATVYIDLFGLSASETVGAFSFLLSFNDTFLAGSSFTLDPTGKMGAGLDFSPGFAPLGLSPLDVYYLAGIFDPFDPVNDELLLKTSEGSGFRLATITFTGVSEGLSTLTLGVKPINGAFLSAYDGVTEIPVGSVGSASICVDDPGTGNNPCTTAVPEASSVALMFVGLAGLAAFAVRRQRFLTEV